MKKHILITGGAGFLGSNLTYHLLSEGHEVYVIDNFVTSSRSAVSEFLKYESYHFFQKDICDNSFFDIFSSVKLDEIYHLACPTGVANLEPLCEEMILTCTSGTRNVMELARRKSARVVFTSSSEVYGNPESTPQTESYSGNVDPLGVRSPYEEGKRISESIVRMYFVKYGVDARIVRVFNTYGPRMDLSDSRVIPRFLLSLRDRRALPVHGDGSQRRTFCYVSDLISGLITVMEKGESGSVYNLGSDREISILELARLMQDVYGVRSSVEHLPSLSHDHNFRLPDLSRVRDLGWSPAVPLERGIYSTVLWYG